MSLFARQGFEGTTTRQIADVARVNEAIIFRHFPSKEDLYWAIIEQKCKGVGRSRMIQEKLAAGGDDLETLTDIAEQFLLRTSRDTDITRLLLFAALERHELSETFFRRYVAETYEALADHLRRGIARGVFRDLDPMLSARSFIGMMVYHFQVQEIFGWHKYQPIDARDAARTLADLWLRGMAAEPASKNGQAKLSLHKSFHKDNGAGHNGNGKAVKAARTVARSKSLRTVKS